MNMNMTECRISMTMVIIKSVQPILLCVYNVAHQYWTTVFREICLVELQYGHFWNCSPPTIFLVALLIQLLSTILRLSHAHRTLERAVICNEPRKCCCCGVAAQLLYFIKLNSVIGYNYTFDIIIIYAIKLVVKLRLPTRPLTSCII
jgi:hypothetical protein